MAKKKDDPAVEEIETGNEPEIETASLEANGVEIEVDEPSVAEEDWKAQLEAAQKRASDLEKEKAEAERLAKDREEEVRRFRDESTQARSQASNANMMAIDNAIANADMEAAEAKTLYKSSMESGDYDGAADAQAKLSEVAFKKQRLKEGKSALERQIEDAKRPRDEVEQFVSTLSPQSGAWIRAHPDSIQRRADLERAHYGAMYKKIAPDTPEYFDFLETELGYKMPQPAVEPMQAVNRTQAAPAAPVSRGGSLDAPQARTTTMRLTAAQREIAEACGMTDAEYAKQLLAIQRETAH